MRLLPAVLVGVEAPLLDRDDELLDLRLVVASLSASATPGGGGASRSALRERLVRVADLVERRRRPLGDAERHACRGTPCAASFRSSAFCFRRAFELLHVALDLDLLELREDALALHVARVRGGVLAVGAELARAMLAERDRLVERRVGAALVADLDLRLREERRAPRARWSRFFARGM